jgi:hypothetical protein
MSDCGVQCEYTMSDKDRLVAISKSALDEDSFEVFIWKA